MFNLILPVCGQSSRFPDRRPKWLLTHPDGKCMLAKSIEGLIGLNFDNIYIIYLKEHNEKYEFIPEISKQFPVNTRFFQINQPTTSQPETIDVFLRKISPKGNLCIKDCDNYFTFSKLKDGCFVGFYSLQDCDYINPSNKSYLLGNEKVECIKEKVVLSDRFCCGYYQFSNIDQWNKYYCGQKYISEIVDHIVSKEDVYTLKCFEYIDWGTIEDWKKYIGKFKTFFVDVDGVLVKSSSEYMKPLWGETEGIKENIDIINKNFDNGCQIILTTARSEEFREKTEHQLKKIGVKYHQIIFGLLNSPRYIINDFSNDYPNAVSINLPRDGNILCKML